MPLHEQITHVQAAADLGLQIAIAPYDPNTEVIV